MNLEIGKVYMGFQLLQNEHIEEINSQALVFVHKITGAKLLKLYNGDDNKVFSIGFRTPPKDSTGVAHILEHSVLCGSRKFPVKEPFVELIKGSLNTFLNAMTFPDKTMYPVASRNKKDFLNLMDVYLDAVFYPNIYKYPEIFMQEGWHYELESEESDIKYKGVVYNEMKGAFSSPESILIRKISESLFPDVTYGVESGGDPDYIPTLSYEEFIDFHKKYYHPSNSYIFLYGDGEILEELKFINDKYLKDFEALNVDSKIHIQKPFSKMREKIIEYPISCNEKEEDKTFLSLNFVTGKSTDRETYLALDILEHLLLETPAAPLKKALIASNIGKDVFGSFDNSILQPTFSVVVKNSNEDKKEIFKKVVLKTLKELVDKGIDKKLIESSINIKEFQLREADFQGYPKGLIYAIKCMDSWLYDKDPLMHIQYEPQLKKVKKALTSDYFEKFINEYILNNNHSSLLIVKPKKGLADEKEKNLKEKLSNYKSTLQQEELEKLISTTKRLKERQQTPDSLEDLKKIPLLSIEDIEKDSEKLPIIEDKIEDMKVLKHNIFTNKIAYINLYFDTRNVPQDLIPYIGLLAGVIGKVNTKGYSYEELSNEININTGGISYTATAYSNNKIVDDFSPILKIRTKVLVEKIPKLFKILGEEIKDSKFDDFNRIKQIIQELKSRIEMSIFDRGHMVAAARLASYFSASSNYIEKVSGLGFYHFIVDIDKNFENRKSEIINNLKEISKLIFNRENLMLSVTLEEEDYNKFKDNFYILKNRLGTKACMPNKYDIKYSKVNQGLMTSGEVQYNAKGFNFKKLGYNYKGSLQVLKTVISFNYLWNKVRVQGGAYGCFGGFNKNGNMYFVSYRDPNLKSTIEVYNNAYSYIDKFSADDREITKYIIGTMSDIDSPLTPSMKGDKAAANYISNITQEDIQKERDEILSTNVEEIKKLTSLVKDCMKENYICVLGSEEKIKKNKDLFNELIHVFE
ncbi:insulinase family protein [Clostridium rectalis]|uniref:insulinase family protein n=1 Tax=Clostridium rectalis TaxID=2040295 RepID=UPI000F63DF8F|nr:insulinase family protein [Clostridium rectalis]